MERSTSERGLGFDSGLVGLGLLFGACSGGKSAADPPEPSSGGAADTMALGGGGATHMNQASSLKHPRNWGPE